MKRIPKKIQLLNHKITVKVIPKSRWPECDADAVGVWDNERNEIRILRQPRTQLHHTFWHEVAHAILDMMGETKISRDERFVDAIGGLLAQTMDSAEF